MFIRTLDELVAAGRIKSLVNDTTRSARFLTRADGMGFSYNENRVSKGLDAILWYKHHWRLLRPTNGSLPWRSLIRCRRGRGGRRFRAPLTAEPRSSAAG